MEQSLCRQVRSNDDAKAGSTILPSEVITMGMRNKVDEHEFDHPVLDIDKMVTLATLAGAEFEYVDGGYNVSVGAQNTYWATKTRAAIAAYLYLGLDIP